MNRGLLTKMARETAVVTTLCSLAIFTIVALLTTILPQVQEGLNDFMLQVPFMRTMAAGVMGIDISEGLTTQMLLAIAWTHPVVLATVWGLAVALSTRIPAGEVDRGTIDILLSWPVSRGRVYLMESVGWLLIGAIVISMGLISFFLVSRGLTENQRPGLLSVTYCSVNLYATYIAVGGATFLVSALSDRRGRAMGIAAGILLFSFLVGFLSQFWEPAEHVRWLSISTWYRPAQIILQGGFPWRDVVVLSVAGALLWAAGGAIFARRSLCPV